MIFMVMANDIRRWIGSKFSWNLSYSEGTPRKKTQAEKLTRQGMEPGAARREVTVLPLDHSSGHSVLFLFYLFSVEIWTIMFSLSLNDVKATAPPLYNAELTHTYSVIQYERARIKQDIEDASLNNLR